MLLTEAQIVFFSLAVCMTRRVFVCMCECVYALVCLCVWGGVYLGKWALLGQSALVHVLEEFLQGIPYCGVTPLLGWQVLQFGTAGKK